MRTAGCVTLYLAFVGAIVTVAWWSWSFRRWQYVENRDPREVFRQIFHVSPPTGVWDIKAAGHQPLDGNFWMRIRTEDIDGLLKGVGASNRADRSALQLFEPTTDQYRRFAASVGWESAHHVNHAEYFDNYNYSNSKGGLIWAMIVDRARHTVYVGAILS